LLKSLWFEKLLDLRRIVVKLYCLIHLLTQNAEHNNTFPVLLHSHIPQVKMPRRYSKVQDNESAIVQHL